MCIQGTDLVPFLIIFDNALMHAAYTLLNPNLNLENGRCSITRGWWQMLICSSLFAYDAQSNPGDHDAQSNPGDHDAQSNPGDQ